MAKGISCVICAYNEADRIGGVLTAVAGHPQLLEVIVVNDGSTDGTQTSVEKFPGVQCITLPHNRGKSFAMAEGIENAQGDTLLLLDADLSGITPGDVSALIEPVMTGSADVSLSLRGNSLLLYRMLGVDFVSGERVIPKSLLASSLAFMKQMPRFGIETYMNTLIIQQQLRIAVVDWPHIEQIRKSKKIGFVRGRIAEIKMLIDVVKTQPMWSLFKQNIRMIQLRVPTRAAAKISADAAQE